MGTLLLTFMPLTQFPRRPLFGISVNRGVPAWWGLTPARSGFHPGENKVDVDNSPKVLED
jgi:hypothetical protein